MFCSIINFLKEFYEKQCYKKLTRMKFSINIDFNFVLNVKSKYIKKIK